MDDKAAEKGKGSCLKMEPIKTAVIDDGVNEKLYNTGMLQHNIEVTPGLEIRQRAGYDPLSPSHGTACAAIIKKYAPDARLSSIKILNDDSRRGMKNQLIKALEWCAGNGVRLVNLSLGTIDFRDFDEVSAAVDSVCKKGLVIVAACNNRNVYTCPASLPNVIGVKCDISGSLEEGEFVFNPFAPDGVEITACGRHSLIKNTGKARATAPCNSFAAPMITAIVHDILKDRKGIILEGIKDELQKRSVSRETIVINSGCKEIDVPIVMIHDCKEGKAYDTAEKLADLFKKDGYNAVAREYRCNRTGCNTADPIVLKSPDELRILYSVYDSDVIIMGTNCLDGIKELESSFEIDVKVLYKYSGRNTVSKDPHVTGDTKVIAVTDNSEDSISEEIKVIKDTGENTLAKLYQCIIGMF